MAARPTRQFPFSFVVTFSTPQRSAEIVKAPNKKLLYDLAAANWAAWCENYTASDIANIEFEGDSANLDDFLHDDLHGGLYRIFYYRGVFPDFRVSRTKNELTSIALSWVRDNGPILPLWGANNSASPEVRIAATKHAFSNTLDIINKFASSPQSVFTSWRANHWQEQGLWKMGLYSPDKAMLSWFNEWGLTHRIRDSGNSSLHMAAASGDIEALTAAFEAPAFSVGPPHLEALFSKKDRRNRF